MDTVGYLVCFQLSQFFNNKSCYEKHNNGVQIKLIYIHTISTKVSFTSESCLPFSSSLVSRSPLTVTPSHDQPPTLARKNWDGPWQQQQWIRLQVVSLSLSPLSETIKWTKRKTWPPEILGGGDTCFSPPEVHTALFSCSHLWWTKQKRDYSSPTVD